VAAPVWIEQNEVLRAGATGLLFPAVTKGQSVAKGALIAHISDFHGARVEEIRALRGMHPERAPVITAGAVVVRETLAHFGIETLEVSEHDIMHGAALAAAELPEEAESGAPPGAHTCC